MRLFRLLSLLDSLRLRHGPVTARDLARETGRSVRTIYRDIADLQAMGAPVRGEGGLGYVLEDGYFLPSLRFDTDELEALALGAGLVAARGDGGLADAARRAAAKIAGAAGPQARDVLASASVAAGTSAVAPSPWLADLRAAIRERRFIEVSYLSLSGAASRRRARPLGLTLFDQAWPLTIWCETAQDFRHLRADRITALTVGPDRFRPERGKRLADSLDREGHGRFPVTPG
jgi:predicted DNA-binding transcriptional regulator YafY